MAELVTTTLREAIDAKAQPGECIVCPFDAIWMRTGKLVRVTAVLNLTAVFEDPDRDFERHLDVPDHFEVGELEWREQSEARKKAQASSIRGRRLANANTARRGPKGWRHHGAADV